MRVKQLGVLLLMAAIFAGSMLAVGCDFLEDAVDDAKDKLADELGIAGEADAIEYFSELDVPTSTSELEKGAYHFADPFYAWKTAIDEKYEEQEDGDYTIIDVIGLSKVRKYMPIKIYFSDYMKFKTFSKDTVTLTDDDGDIPGIYLLTFLWKQAPDPSILQIKPNKDGLEKLIDAASEFKDLTIPDKSMIVIVPFRKAKGTVNLTVKGKELLDVQDNPIKSIPKPSEGAAKEEVAEPTPGEDVAKPGQTEQVEGDTCQLSGEADDTEPEAPAEMPGDDRIRIGEGDDGETEGDITIQYEGNAGMVTINTMFPVDTHRPNFDVTGREFGKKAALLTSGDVCYYESDDDNFCDSDDDGSIDSDELYAVDGKYSTLTATITLPSDKSKIAFDYFWISAEVNEWCYENTNYNDEVVVSITPAEGGSGQPIVTTIETQAQYFADKDAIDIDYELVTDSSKGDVTMVEDFDHWSHDGTFGVCSSEEGDKKWDPKKAEFDVSGFSGAVTFTIMVTDVGDSWNTSMILVDNIRFE